MRIAKLCISLLLPFAAVTAMAAPATAQQQRPNITFIMGDDIGWSNIGVYNQGILAGRMPDLDQLASEGMRKGASFNLEAVKAQIQRAIEARHAN